MTHRTVGAEQYGHFLVEVFDEWVRHDVGDVFVQMFDTTLAHWLGMDQAGMCVHARDLRDRAGPRAQRRPLLLRPLRRGRTTCWATSPRAAPCSQLVASPQQTAFGDAKLDTLPQYCRDCDVRFACNGGCPKDRFLTTPDGEPGLNYLCAGYQRFFRHVDEPMRVMADLLRRGEDATGVKEWYADHAS